MAGTSTFLRLCRIFWSNQTFPGPTAAGLARWSWGTLVGVPRQAVGGKMTHQPDDSRFSKGYIVWHGDNEIPELDEFRWILVIIWWIFRTWRQTSPPKRVDIGFPISQRRLQKIRHLACQLLNEDGCNGGRMDVKNVRNGFHILYGCVFWNYEPPKSTSVWQTLKHFQGFTGATNLPQRWSWSSASPNLNMYWSWWSPGILGGWYTQTRRIKAMIVPTWQPVHPIHFCFGLTSLLDTWKSVQKEVAEPGEWKNTSGSIFLRLLSSAHLNKSYSNKHLWPDVSFQAH